MQKYNVCFANFIPGFFLLGALQLHFEVKVIARVTRFIRFITKCLYEFANL